MSELRPNRNDTGKGTDINLRQLLRVLNKRRILIALITLVFATVTGLVSFYGLSPLYQTETLLMIPIASENSPGSTVTTPSPMPVLTMNTYLMELRSEAMMKRVLDSINLPGQTIGSLSAMINANIITDSNLIEVKVVNKDPLVAYQIATAVSDQYPALINQFMSSSVVVVSPANIPTDPVKPDKKLNIAVGFAVGLILSILLAFLLEYLDTTLKSTDDINRELNLSVLGLIPTKTDQNSRQMG